MYSDFLWQRSAADAKDTPTKLRYVALTLKSSLLKLYGHHHDLVWPYEIFIYQMTMEVFHFFSLSPTRLSPDLTILQDIYTTKTSKQINVRENHRGNQEWTIQRHWQDRAHIYTTKTNKHYTENWKDEQHVPHQNGGQTKLFIHGNVSCTVIFCDRDQLLAQKILQQSYVTLLLRWSHRF
jgi:hypothetical protein